MDQSSEAIGPASRLGNDLGEFQGISAMTEIGRNRRGFLSRKNRFFKNAG
jgi:hypothetical protein